ncbi:MAG: ATP-binding protein [Lachnospiraceae bacterium]|nr:ATP-binding protein [Lachnospiraceae bacterium]
MKSKGKKRTYLIRGGMSALTIVLIVLFFVIMSLVGKIQGTARVVNYAGLVRGGTQRMVKLEIAGKPQDKMQETIRSYIEGLRNGSSELNFVRLDDRAFQNKMDELADYFETLTEAIRLVREKGYTNTDIIEKSEHFFGICDEAVGLAEDYSQHKATALDHLEKVVFWDIAGLILLIGAELVKAFRFAAQNRVLQKKVYLDEATNLPNKNKCEEILNAPEAVASGDVTAVCVFDLNNLRTINNRYGHDRGDAYIRIFATLLREAVPETYFVGRDGGDEFLVVFSGLGHEAVQERLAAVKTHTDAYSAQHPEMPVSYAVGYALSTDFEGSTMRELFRIADKNMYIDKSQAKLEEAESESRAKTEFMNRMSHDIRTPINGILGMLEIIRKNRTDEGKVDECLKKIRLSTSHLLALVNDVLDMSRLQSGRMQMETEVFDLQELMEEVSALVDAQVTQSGLIHYRKRGTIEHTILCGSPLQLRRVMVNLLSNAIKYNKPGGSITTWAGEISAKDGVAWYEFVIEDTGIGMSEEFVAYQLFEPFTQEENDARTQYRGTGLGMSIVKGTLEAMGGTIQVTSKLGEGTRMAFRLPFDIVDTAVAKPKEPEKPTAGEAEKELAGKRILLAEDNEINMEIAEFYAVDHGAVVEKARNGKEALKMFARSSPERFDVILMDVMMPVMDGLEATRQIRALPRDDAKTVCIVAMTAQTANESIEKCLQAGMNGHIAKPVEAGQMVKEVLAAMQEAKTSARAECSI